MEVLYLPWTCDGQFIRSENSQKYLILSINMHSTVPFPNQRHFLISCSTVLRSSKSRGSLSYSCYALGGKKKAWNATLLTEKVRVDLYKLRGGCSHIYVNSDPVHMNRHPRHHETLKSEKKASDSSPTVVKSIKVHSVCRSGAVVSSVKKIPLCLFVWSLHVL